MPSQLHSDNLLSKDPRQQKYKDMEDLRKEDMEDEVIDKISNTVVMKFRVPWTSRSQMSNILHSAIEESCKEILESYKACLFDSIANFIQSEFNIPMEERIKPNFDYADHAKLDPIIEMLKKKFPEIEKNFTVSIRKPFNIPLTDGDACESKRTI